MRLIAILSGSDWYDASVEHIEIPDKMNLENEYTAYIKWLRTDYHSNTKTKHQSFTDFLKSRGATDTDKVEIFEN